MSIFEVQIVGRTSLQATHDNTAAFDVLTDAAAANTKPFGNLGAGEFGFVGSLHFTDELVVSWCVFPDLYTVLAENPRRYDRGDTLGAREPEGPFFLWRRNSGAHRVQALMKPEIDTQQLAKVLILLAKHQLEQQRAQERELEDTDQPK